jgi:regulator of protease activity HflC (stomatin/prohibitin superfamily)
MWAILSASNLTIAGLTIASLVVVFRSFVLVPQGFEYTLERFGRYVQSLQPGLAFMIPFVDRIAYKVDLREQVGEIQRQSVISADNAVVNADGVVFFRVVNSADSVYKVRDLDRGIRNLCLTNIRTVLGSMTADEILSHRDRINTSLLKVVDKAADTWGVKVTRVEIKDILPPDDLVDAMSRQLKAERQKRAEILEAEGRRQSEILHAEGKKQSAILTAEGEKEAAYRIAEARERGAAAEAEATKVVSDAIRNGDDRSINYFVAKDYVEALKSIGTADNEKLVILPIEATSILGALGGVGEIAKQAFRDSN